jgi:hypothetical protein
MGASAHEDLGYAVPRGAYLLKVQMLIRHGGEPRIGRARCQE